VTSAWAWCPTYICEEKNIYIYYIMSLYDKLWSYLDNFSLYILTYSRDGIVFLWGQSSITCVFFNVNGFLTVITHCHVSTLNLFTSTPILSYINRLIFALNLHSFSHLYQQERYVILTQNIHRLFYYISTMVSLIISRC